MSDRLPDVLRQLQGGGTPLMPARPVTPPLMPQQAPPAPQPPAVPMRHVHAALADAGQEAMIRKRDTAGKEMAKLADIANDPDPNRADIAAYIGKLTRTGQVTPEEATQILQGLPQDANGIRQWARTMLGVVMQVGIHAHAAFPREIFPGAPQSEAPESNGGVAPQQEEQPDGR